MLRTGLIVNNILTLVLMIILIFGALYLGAGGYSWLALLLLCNIVLPA